MDSKIEYNKANKIELNIEQIRIYSHIRKHNKSSSKIKNIYLVIIVMFCVGFLVVSYYVILWLLTL